MNHIRQGDVLLIKVKELPKQKLRIKPQKGRIVLLEGEATGHHHSLIASEDVKGWLSGEKLFLELLKPSIIEHQEHGPIELEPGLYEMAEQVEDDGREDARRVAD